MLLALLAASHPAGSATSIDNPIVFVKQTPVSATFATISDIFGNFTSFDPSDGQPTGGGLFRLDVNGKTKQIAGNKNSAVRDPEISFDGKSVLFAMKRRKLLGEASIRADGSFAIAVPPNTPIIWEILNNSGKMLAEERFWTKLAPGEVRTCNGCHAPHKPKAVSRKNSALENVSNLSGRTIDGDKNGLADLVEALGLIRR